MLFGLSYDFVGDLAETVSLIWPSRPGVNREPDLSEVVDALRSASRAEVQRLLEGWLDALDADGRWALLKLLTGGLRVGVSARLAKQALADLGGIDVAEIEEGLGEAPAAAFHERSIRVASRNAATSRRPTRRRASGR